MCRSIKPLANLAPPASDEEIRAAALQFVRKLSNARQPSRANAAAFERAVDEITVSAAALLRALTATTPPRDRDEEARKAKVRASKRYGEAARAAG